MTTNLQSTVPLWFRDTTVAVISASRQPSCDPLMSLLHMCFNNISLRSQEVRFPRYSLCDGALVGMLPSCTLTTNRPPPLIHQQTTKAPYSKGIIICSLVPDNEMLQFTPPLKPYTATSLTLMRVHWRWNQLRNAREMDIITSDLGVVQVAIKSMSTSMTTRVEACLFELKGESSHFNWEYRAFTSP